MKISYVKRCISLLENVSKTIDEECTKIIDEAKEDNIQKGIQAMALTMRIMNIHLQCKMLAKQLKEVGRE